MVEPTRLLTADELAERVCATLACPHHPHLVAPSPAPKLIVAPPAKRPSKKAA